MVGIAENKIKLMIMKETKLKAAIKITVYGKRLKLNPFFQKIMRTVVLSMVLTLKDISIEEDENVFTTITSPSK